MNGYEKILDIMKKQARKEKEEGMRIAVVVEDAKIKFGELILDPDDYLVAESVMELSNGDSVLIYPISDSKYIVICKVVT